jgi:ubiquinone/menaquinone biosynthesis C-methylase UbiE
MEDRIRISEAAHAGQAIYTPLMLKAYDISVLGFNNHLIWRCPTRILVDHYNSHVSSNHLDVGVGSGYMLDHCRFPTPSPRLVLMDLNNNCLEMTARRVSRYRPNAVRCNVLEPISFDGEPFDSIGFNYVLHCLPGAIPEKEVAFDHLRGFLRSGGVIFGSTILSQGVERGYLARKTMDLFNSMRSFSNAHDSLADLRRALEDRFRDVSIRTVGCVALFSGRAP